MGFGGAVYKYNFWNASILPCNMMGASRNAHSIVQHEENQCPSEEKLTRVVNGEYTFSIFICVHIFASETLSFQVVQLIWES